MGNILKECAECGAKHVNKGNYCDDCLMEGRRQRERLYRDFDKYGHGAL
jgi:hypothetical protein